jgi:hypothetical protein
MTDHHVRPGLVDVRTAAQRLGISEAALRTRIRRGTIASRKIEGCLFVVLDEEASSPSTDTLPDPGGDEQRDDRADPAATGIIPPWPIADLTQQEVETIRQQALTIQELREIAQWQEALIDELQQRATIRTADRRPPQPAGTAAAPLESREHLAEIVGPLNQPVEADERTTESGRSDAANGALDGSGSAPRDPPRRPQITPILRTADADVRLGTPDEMSAETEAVDEEEARPYSPYLDAVQPDRKRTRRLPVVALALWLLLIAYGTVRYFSAGETMTEAAPRNTAVAATRPAGVVTLSTTEALYLGATPSPQLAASTAGIPSGAVPSPTIAVTRTPTEAPIPTEAPRPTEAPPALIERVAAAEATVETGQLEAVIEYGDGTRSIALVTFDLRADDGQPRLHIVNTYEGREQTQVTEQVLAGDRVWRRATDGSWVAVSEQQEVWGNVQAFLPRVDAAVAQAQPSDTDGVTQWYDASRDADVTLEADPATGVPIRRTSVARGSKLVITVTYHNWNEPVAIPVPEGE